ncbi:hypothetical protein C6495_04435 [Candidatus Poribacteria bacterium]|nr:MAG: hypothetical protein C6495_04435 [Candidatus Poribacteria bacterium]
MILAIAISVQVAVWIISMLLWCRAVDKRAERKAERRRNSNALEIELLKKASKTLDKIEKNLRKCRF